MITMTFKIINRNRLMSRNIFHASTNIWRINSNEWIKFIGRQHSFLTKIMDQLNFCYSFQVKHFRFVYSLIIHFLQNALFNQMMGIIGIMFVDYVSAFHLIIQHSADKTDYKTAIIQFAWELFSLISMLIIIFTAYRVSSEVSNIWNKI